MWWLAACSSSPSPDALRARAREQRSLVDAAAARVEADVRALPRYAAPFRCAPPELPASPDPLRAAMRDSAIAALCAGQSADWANLDAAAEQALGAAWLAEAVVGAEVDLDGCDSVAHDHVFAHVGATNPTGSAEVALGEVDGRRARSTTVWSDSDEELQVIGLDWSFDAGSDRIGATIWLRAE